MKVTDAMRIGAARSGGWFPLFFIIPPLLVAKILGKGHWGLFFASFIPGSLLIALWPPRKQRTLIFGLATATAMAILVIVAQLTGGNDSPVDDKSL